MRYMLDTNILSDLVRHPQGRIYQKITEVGEGQTCTSVIVASELRYGASKSGSQRLVRQVNTILDAIDVEPLTAPSDKIYGELRTRLEKQGNLIGPNDLLIAAQALAIDCVLVTANMKEFSRVSELKLENWLQDE